MPPQQVVEHISSPELEEETNDDRGAQLYSATVSKPNILTVIRWPEDREVYARGHSTRGRGGGNGYGSGP